MNKKVPYSLGFKEGVEKTFEKIAKKDRLQEEAIKKKINAILEDPYQFKPLRAPFAGMRRVHVMKSFVLIYSIDKANKMVVIERYKHHDDAYLH